MTIFDPYLPIDVPLSKREKILFVVNPIAGNTGKERIAKQIVRWFAKNEYETEIIHTQNKGEATEIVERSLKNGVEKFIAVGGDGTINEMGKVLLNSKGVLGIIPMGSGNGLARHLGVPMRSGKAMRRITEGRIIKIDTARINEIPFICTAGLGFDAHVGRMFELDSKRGFRTYIKKTASEYFRYKPDLYKIGIGEKVYEREAFLLTFANASQFGNNALIAPSADLKDGLLDLVIMSSVPIGRIPEMGIRLFTGKIDRSRYLEVIQLDRVEVSSDQDQVAIHYDGEPGITSSPVKVEIVPSSLQVIV